MIRTVWEVEFDIDAARQMGKLGAVIRESIKAYLRDKIATTDDPERFGKALGGKLKGLWRYRVGDYRIVARIEKHRVIVVVVAVALRFKVYR